MPAVIERGRRAGLRHFLFGSTPDVLNLLESRLRTLIPEVEIVGAYAPAIGEEHSPQAIASIRSTRPDIIWIALGAPRQEMWMHRHVSDLEPALVLGVGAAFDFLAGTKSRAPRLLRNTGFEWLHRLLVGARKAWSEVPKGEQRLHAARLPPPHSAKAVRSLDGRPRCPRRDRRMHRGAVASPR